MARILLSTEKHWHTYWRNAGDSGEPPTVNWQSPSDITFGEFHWPIPTQIPVAHLTNYGYEGKTLLMVPFTINKLAPEVSRVSITADLSWLVCKEDCIPGWATIRQSLLNGYTTPRGIDNLLPLQTPARFGGRTFALPPEMPGLQALYQQGNMAVVGNVGPLLEPTTKTAVFNETANLPARLFLITINNQLGCPAVLKEHNMAGRVNSTTHYYQMATAITVRSPRLLCLVRN